MAIRLDVSRQEDLRTGNLFGWARIKLDSGDTHFVDFIPFEPQRKEHVTIEDLKRHLVRRYNHRFLDYQQRTSGGDIITHDNQYEILNWGLMDPRSVAIVQRQDPDKLIMATTLTGPGNQDLLALNPPPVQSSILDHPLRAGRGGRNHSIPQRNGTCAWDYIAQILIGNRGFRTLTYQEIQEMLPEPVTANSILEWARSRNSADGVAVRVFDPMQYNKIAEHKPVETRHELVFVVRDHHLVPIIDEELIEYSRRHASLGVFMRQKWHYDPDHVYVDMTDSDRLLELCEGVDTTTKQFMTNGDVFEIMMQCQRIHGVIHDQVSVNPSRDIIGFQHPTKPYTFRFTEDYEERKRACEALRDVYPGSIFKFKNQPWLTIGQDLFDVTVGNIARTYDCFDEFTRHHQPVPLCQNLTEPDENVFDHDDPLALDHKKCYFTMLKKSCVVPVFTSFDEWIPFEVDDEKRCELREGREYLVENVTVHGLNMPCQIMSFHLVNYLIRNRHIRWDNIRFQREGKKILRTAQLEPFINALEALSEDEKLDEVIKKTVNPMIGAWNQRSRKIRSGYVTTDQQEAMGLFTLYANDNKHVTIRELEISPGTPVFYMTLLEKKPLSTNLGSLWRHIVCQCNLTILRQIDRVLDVNPYGELTGCKTDAVYFKNCTELPEDPGGVWRQECYSLPKYSFLVERNVDEAVAELRAKPWQVRTRDDVFGDDYSSFCVLGPGGSGKTQFVAEYIKHLIEDGENGPFRVVSFTNSAKNTFKKRLRTVLGDLWRSSRSKITVSTIDSFLWPVEMQIRQYQPVKWPAIELVVVDEVSMVNKRHMALIRRLVYETGCSIVFAGDFNQCRPVEAEDHIVYRYESCKIFKELCQYNVVRLKASARTARGDASAIMYADYFLKYHRLHPHLEHKPIDNDLKDNVTKLNRTRRRINDKFFHGFEIGEVIIANPVDPKERELRERGLYTSEFYTILAMNRSQVKVATDVDPDGVWFDKNRFEPTFAVTVYRYQGKAIPRPFNILDTQSMTFEEMYTALTRATKGDDIHVKWTSQQFHSQEVKAVDVKLKKAQRLKFWELENGSFVGKSEQPPRSQLAGESFVRNQYDYDDYVLTLRGEHRRQPERRTVVNNVSKSFLKMKYKIGEHKDFYYIKYYQDGNRIMKKFRRTRDDEDAKRKAKKFQKKLVKENHKDLWELAKLRLRR